MTKLNDKYYDGIVVSDEVDPNHAGAVRTKIFGVTDELDDKDQPFAVPAVVNFSAVPTKGIPATILRKFLLFILSGSVGQYRDREQHSLLCREGIGLWPHRY